MDIGKFLYDNRLKAVQLAEYLEVTSGAVSRWVSGDSKPTDKKIEQLLNNPYGWETSALQEKAAMAPVMGTKDQRDTTIPLIPLDASAGVLGDYIDGVTLGQCERISSPIAKATCAIRVCGDSMTPRFNNGDVLFLSKINEKAFIEWGRPYVLSTENGIVCKVVQKSPSPGEVLCESYNKDYQTFEVKTDFILGWYKVVGCLSLV